jgi:undecaprenyl-diphosphatase
LICEYLRNLRIIFSLRIIMETLWTALIMGIVEGITEYLPVSSTGHLIVAGHLIGFTGQKAATFEVFIQLGAILAVVVLYWRRFIGLLPGADPSGLGEVGFSGFRGIGLLLLTTFPCLVTGYLFHGAIKEYLFTPVTVAWALAVGGVGILTAERLFRAPSVKDLDGLTALQAFTVGLFQCLSLWPGVSRSASSIIGGMAAGLDRRVAVEYSFLAAAPVMCAAVTYDLFKARAILSAEDVPLFGLGALVSFLSAAAAIKTFIALVQRWTLAPYAYYRMVAAGVIYYFYVSGKLV